MQPPDVLAHSDGANSQQVVEAKQYQLDDTALLSGPGKALANAQRLKDEIPADRVNGNHIALPTAARTMKAVVLAAGFGKRMQPLTDYTHKSLLPVGRNTILGRIVDSLVGINIPEIVVVTGHRSEEVEGFLLKNYPDLSFVFVHNDRYRETNNIVSLNLALDKLEFDSDIVLIECDLLFDPAALYRLTNAEPGNIALVDRFRPGMDGTVVSVENGFISQVFPPHLQSKDFDYSDKFKTVNIYRFDKDFCRNKFKPLLACYANAVDEGCYYELVLGMLINMQREKVRAELTDDIEWLEIDDPNEFAAARFTFEPEHRSQILARAHGGHWNFEMLDFTFMRNMYFPTDEMLAAMRRSLPALVFSYGSAERVLNEKLGYVLRCEPERVQCLHGAAQIFPFLPNLLNPRRTLLPLPTFGEFPRWLRSDDVYFDAVGIDFDDLAGRVSNYDLVVIVNPNNPTGTTLSTALLHDLIAEHSSTTFLVDESFIEFSGQERLLDRLEREPLDNVLIMASLSKSLGIPGLRLGYAYTCNRKLMDGLRKQIPIWNLGALSEYFLELLLKFRSKLAVALSSTAVDRASMGMQLARMKGIDAVYPSGGNFLLARLTGNDPTLANQVVDHLLVHHLIYVKDVSSKFPERGPYLRFAVRRPAENLRLFQALAASLAHLEA
jgi:histidinol-phosphate/aromatic aminotransferase/cobyric acid decarboxylase-like protein/choline kinase